MKNIKDYSMFVNERNYNRDYNINILSVFKPFVGMIKNLNKKSELRKIASEFDNYLLEVYLHYIKTVNDKNIDSTTDGNVVHDAEESEDSETAPKEVDKTEDKKIDFSVIPKNTENRDKFVLEIQKMIDNKEYDKIEDIRDEYKSGFDYYDLDSINYAKEINKLQFTIANLETKYSDMFKLKGTKKGKDKYTNFDRTFMDVTEDLEDQKGTLNRYVKRKAVCDLYANFLTNVLSKIDKESVDKGNDINK